jgi:hypothetical protein
MIENRIRNKNDYLRFLISQAEGGESMRAHNDCLIPHSIFKISKKSERNPDDVHVNDEDEEATFAASECINVKKLKIYHDVLEQLTRIKDINFEEDVKLSSQEL